MNYEHKRSIINALIMIFLCAFFVLGMEMSKRPDAEALASELLQLDGYSQSECKDAHTGVYNALYSLGAKKVVVCSVPDTCKEFAIAEFRKEAPESADEIFCERILQLKEEFGYDAEALELLENADILRVNQFAVLTVYDTEDTAEKRILHYLGFA